MPALRVFLFALTAGVAAAEEGPTAEWTIVDPTAATASGGAVLRELEDHSLLAEGANPKSAVYEIEFQTDLQAITALRIEFLADPSLPKGGPGRCPGGNIVLSEVTVSAQGTKEFGSPEGIELREAGADHTQNSELTPASAIDGRIRPDDGWAPEGHVNHADCQIVVVPWKPFGSKSGTIVRVALHFESKWEQHAAGRVRLAITSEPRAELVLPSRRGPSDDEIARATEKGIEFLLGLQESDGSWLGPDWTVYPVGMTALAAHTLLHCGLGREHPAIRAAMSYVEQHEPIRTYEIGCVLMAYRSLGEPFPRERIRALTRRLLETMGNSEKDGPALWGYPHGWGYPNDMGDHLDLSNTQYAALGLRAALGCGEKVPPQIFEKIARDVIADQGGYGEFRYRPGINPSSSMVVAGLTCVLVCREALERQAGFDGSLKRIEASLLKADLWLKDNWSVDRVLEVPRVPNPNDRWDFYYTYGLERVGSIWNRRLVGGHDWYSEGAEALLRRQGKDGSWGTAYGEKDSNTCFALLFITRASAITGGEVKRRSDPAADAAAFTILASREDPFVAWVGELRSSVTSRLDGGQRVAGVEWLLNGEKVATVPLGADKNPLLERFTLRQKLSANGPIELSAVMRFLAADGADSGAEASNVYRCSVDFVEEPSDRETLRDAGKNLVVSAAGNSAATSQRDGYLTAERAADGRHGTSWLAAVGDAAPALRLSFKRPPSATVLKLLQARAYSGSPTGWARAREIEVQINANRPQTFFLLDDPSLKQRIVFKPQALKQVRIAVKSVYEGESDAAAVGFREVEAFATAGPETAEDVTAFASVETVFPRGSEWRYSTAAPESGWKEPAFDDSVLATGASPFGTGQDPPGTKTQWPTAKLFARRAFEAPERDTATYSLRVLADDEAEVWVNGRRAGRVGEHTRGKLRGVTLRRSLIRPGRNVIAVEVTDTGGIRGFDAELLRYVP